MKRVFATSIVLFLSVFLVATLCGAGKYQNFIASVYARVYEVRQMSDLDWLEPRWNTITSQVNIDKIYLETHRDMIVAEADTLRKLKGFFQERGVQVAGGMPRRSIPGNVDCWCALVLIEQHLHEVDHRKRIFRFPVDPGHLIRRGAKST